MDRHFRSDKATLDRLDWPLLQQKLASYTKTKMGESHCLNFYPGTIPFEELHHYAQAILELSRLQSLQSLELPIGGCPDIHNIFSSIEKQGQLLEDDLVALVSFQKTIDGLIYFLEKFSTQCPYVCLLLEDLTRVHEWSSQIYPLVNNRGKIDDSASSDLHALRMLEREWKEKIDHHLKEYFQNPRYSQLLQDTYITIREGRYVLPVKVNHKGKVKGIIHDVSHSEQTAFIEPQELVHANNELKLVEKEIVAEIEKILRDVVKKSSPYLSQLQNNNRLLCVADYLSAANALVGLWKTQEKIEMVIPEWGHRFDFEDFSHPILQLDQSMVKNTLSWRGAFVVSGPNTGGKTVLLKGIGLLIALAWSGFPLPAKNVTLPKECRGLWAELGDEQSIEKHLSTFSAHLLSLKEIMSRAKEGDLVLIDEIATGTSPEEGQPLAQAVMEYMLDLSLHLFVTTHYGKIKHFSMTSDRARIGAMSFDVNDKKPNYKLILDIPGESSAFETASNIGFEEKIIERANELKGDVSQDFKIAITRLEESRKRFSAKELELQKSIHQLEQKENELIKEKEKYRKWQGSVLGDEAKETIKQLKALKKEFSQNLKKMKQDISAKQGAKIQDDISLSIEIAEQFSDINSEAPFQPIKNEDFIEGNFVRVKNLGVGKLVEVPRDLSKKSSKAKIKIGDFITEVVLSNIYKATKNEVDHLQKIEKQSSEAERRHQVQESRAKSSASSESLVCDLRGMRVDEALDRVDRALNQLSSTDNASITIIHGHGMNRLKESVTQYLKERDDVSYRAGAWPGEGGGGVTIVEKASS